MTEYYISDNVLYEKVGEEIVIVNVNNDKMYELNPTGAIFFEKISQGISVDEIVEYLINEFKVDKKTVKIEIENITKLLTDAGILNKS